MKRLSLVLLLSGCIFGEPGNPDTPNNVNGMTATNGSPNSELGEPVDCSDCVGSVELIRESTGLLPERTGCGRGAAATDLGAWARINGGGIAAVGTRCADAELVWDADEFVMRPGPNVGDWMTIGNMAMGSEPKSSLCTDSWLIGLETRKNGDDVATVRALCGTISLQFFDDGDGGLVHRFNRTGVDPGPTVPAENCGDDNCGNVESIRCADDGIAVGVAGRLDDIDTIEGVTLRDFDLVCATLAWESAN